MIDNNPRISGKAISMLQRAGILVTILPDCLAEIAKLNKDFLEKKRS